MPQRTARGQQNEAEAISIEPTDSADPLKDGSRGSDALSTSSDPWMAAMRRGDFASAWRISDAVLAARRARGEPSQQGARHLQSIWTGEPLTGKRVLVRCYHGLGDTVQFIRFAAPLRNIAAEVIVWAQLPLVPLLATAAGVDRVLPLHDGVPDVAFDCDIEIMELAHALRVDASSIPREVPYLFPPILEDTIEASSGELKIGLVWCAGDWDPERSLPAELLTPLARLSGVRLLSVQRGSAAGESRVIPAQDAGSDDMEQTAARLHCLDLLISVDTFPAHLAGALGIPVWLLLKAHCDWRWMEHCTHTVWYPTMRLFRQRRPGDWPSAIAEITRELKKILRRLQLRKDLEQTSASDVRMA